MKREGYLFAMVTTNKKGTVVSFLERYGINVFDFICSESRMFGKGKKIRTTLKRLNVAPENALYVGDEVRDIEAAHGVGVRVVAVTWGYNNATILQQRDADFVVHTPQELIQTLIRELPVPV